MLIKQQKTEKIPHCSWLNNVSLNNLNMLNIIYSISVAYLKHVHILENVVNMIKDLSYPPTRT